MYMTISRASKSGELEVGGRKSEHQRCAIILAGLNLKARIKLLERSQKENPTEMVRGTIKWGQKKNKHWTWA